MIKAELEFLQPDSDKPSYVMRELGEDFLSTGSYHKVEVEISNARESEVPITLDRHGFELLAHSSQLGDLSCEQAIKEEYLVESCALVKQRLEALRVEAIDYTVRTTDPRAQQRPASPRVHNDYTEASARAKFQSWLGSEFEPTSLKHRLLQLNLWRAFTEPVQRRPLVIADGSSVRPADLVPCDVIYSDRVGENFEVRHSPSQQWFYFPEMTKDEVVLIKGYDSKVEARARLAPHTSFTHPMQSVNAPHRWSIEVRMLVVI